MTREEAIKTLKEAMYFIDGLGARVISSKMAEALAALETCTVEPSKPAQLDENGLVPCGCGGKARLLRKPIGNWVDHKIACDSCTMETAWAAGKDSADMAKIEWNTAMGYKGGAE